MYYFSTILLVLLADQLTKSWIVDAFQLHESREILPGLFNLVYVTNTGAAFSMLADINSPWRHWFFLGIGSLAIIGLTWTWYSSRHNGVTSAISLAMIAGGAAGNLIDRVRFGSVIDFLDFYQGNHHWPSFNVADSAICVGAGLFIIISLLSENKEQNRSKE